MKGTWVSERMLMGIFVGATSTERHLTIYWMIWMVAVSVSMVAFANLDANATMIAGVSISAIARKGQTANVLRYMGILK